MRSIGVYQKTMAELSFEINGRVGDISANTFDAAIHHSVGLLREFDSAISGRPNGSLRWYIGRLHSNGSLLVTFLSRQKPARRKRDRLPDVSPTVADSFITGFEDLEVKAETPPYLSEFGLRRAEELTGLIGRNGAEAFTFKSLDKTIQVTHQATENISKLLPIRRYSIGSVEGLLEAINLHKKPRIIVYHAITNKAISCEFDQDTWMHVVKENLGKRVTVFGRLHKNANGDTLRVTVEQIKPATGKRFALPDIGPLGEPDFVAATSTAEYLRSIRGG
jgi:hypothetical protein